MNSNRWQQIEEIFQRAVELTPEDRSAFLKQECRNDFTLKKEIEKLLSNYDSAESFIESPVWTDSFFINSSAKKEISDSFDEFNEEVKDDLIGKKIGVYQLVKELGKGGMGAVYLGMRADGEFKQKVAVKLIKRGMDSDFIIRRFRHERQILASFDHPFIGRLLDGGTTSDGLPYFVMEFVEGDTLYNFCDQNHLTIRERLEIFRQICSAVSYAHERGIIHRDIKPSNILFAQSGVPKLLDFGIAKVLDSDLIHESVNPTASMMRLMTPDYASPEQVCGSEVTSASDIYSLGILLYELLTGHRPYNFAGKALYEVSRVICEVTPDLPSEILQKNENILFRYEQSPEKIYETRRTTKSELKQLLVRELDNIIMKALEKESSNRYVSVEEFSEDIHRFLTGESVKAKTFNPAKKGKLKNEERTSTTAKSLAVLPFKFLSLVKSEDTGDEFMGVGLADALITRLSKIRRFVVRPTSSILGFEEKGIDPISAARQLDVSYILDGTIKKAGKRLRVTVQLLDVAENSTVWATSIDETISDLFSLEDALSTKVIEALLPQLTGGELKEFQKRGTESAEAFEQYLRGRYYFNTGTEEGFAKAFVSFHQAIAADPNYAHAHAGIANYYSWLGIYGVLPPQECFQPAILAAEKAVELDDELAEAHATLGFAVHAGNFDHPKAIFHLTRALELNPHYADAFASFAIIRFTEGRFQEGLVLATRAAELDPLTPYNHHNIAWGLYYARRFDESIKLYKKSIADFPAYGLNYYCLSKNLRFIGETEEAIRQIEKAKSAFGDSIFVMIAEAESLAANGDAEKAQGKLEELNKIAESRYVSPYQLALVYCYLKNIDKALELLEKAAEHNEAWLNWMNVEPVFDFLREDKRFQKIREHIGSKGFPGEISIENKNLAEKRNTHNINDLTTLILENDEKQTAQTAATVSLKSKKFWQKPWVYLIFAFIVIAIIVRVLFFVGVLSLSVTKNGVQKPAVSITNAQAIVVLPFKTENAADENLGVGLADVLSNRLGYIRRLSVIAPNSGRAMKDGKISEIGKNLKVGFVLRGTLIKNSNEEKVVAELVNASDETIIWTENFTVSDGNLFDIQTKIAEKIWTSMGIEPLPNEREQLSKSYTKKRSAYDLYLIGRYQLANRSPENIHKAINTFTQAQQEDLAFAAAYAGLADSYALLRTYEFPPPGDAFEKAKEFALKAIELDENLVEAHTSLAYIKFYGDRDRVGAELEFRRAIQLNPSYSQAHHWFGLLLIAMNRPVDAIAEIKTAEQLDPSSMIIKTALAMAYFHNKQYDEAIAECEKVLAINKDFVPAYRVLRSAYQMKNDYQSARSALQNELSFSGGEIDDPGWFMIIAQVESLNGDKKKIAEKLDKSVEQPVVKDNPSTYSYEIALAYNALGEREKALKWLENAEANADNGFVFLEVDPRFDNLRNEPQFQKLLENLKK